MDKKTEASLMKLAKDTAGSIRRRTRISGWHEDERRFPQSDYKDILTMLEKAYSLGRAESEEAANKKHKALIDIYDGQMEWSGCSERGTMEALIEVFEPEELVKLGYGERVKAYFDEYGAEGDWEEISRKAAGA